MKIIKTLKISFVLLALLFTHTAFAFDVGGAIDRCFAPKFKSFSPPKKTKNTPVPEVEPQSKISFTVSGTAEPSSIYAVAKGQPLKLNIIDKQNFFAVSAQLPAVFNDEYVRIHLRAKAKHGEGECKTKGGWLIKVKKLAESIETSKE